MRKKYILATDNVFLCIIFAKDGNVISQFQGNISSYFCQRMRIAFNVEKMKYAEVIAQTKTKNITEENFRTNLSIVKATMVRIET